ncbi:MAG: FMN-binding protein [Bacillota bacterium]
MKKIYKVLSIFLLIFILTAGGMFIYIKYFNEVPEVEAETINLSRIKDGTYQGAYNVNLVTAEIRVKVDEGKITAIDILEHKNGLGGKAEKITDDILAAQSLKVDTVSGATISSQAILKAVELALTK